MNTVLGKPEILRRSRTETIRPLQFRPDLIPEKQKNDDSSNATRGRDGYAG